jgi:hypothetical protein
MSYCSVLSEHSLVLSIYIKKQPPKNDSEARLQRLAPIIPATQEAEIRRIAVQSQPGQIVCETLSRKTLHKTGVVEWFVV